MDMGRRCASTRARGPSDETLSERWRRCFSGQRRPVILAGQELATHDAFTEAAELAELLGAPVFQALHPLLGALSDRAPGLHGGASRQQKQVRAMLEPYDLLICLGADLLRMSVYSPVEPLPEGLPVIHVSERAHELGKNYRTDLAVHAERQGNAEGPFAFAAQATSRGADPTPRRAESSGTGRAQRDKARVERCARRRPRRSIRST